MSKRIKKPLHKFSIYRRTLIWMIIVILVIFIVLATVYSFLNSKARLEQLEIQLLSSAQATAERVEHKMDKDKLTLTTSEEKGYLAFAAKSSESIVWLINSEGEIIYFSALPLSSREKLKEHSESGLYLTQEMLNDSTISSHGKSDMGNFHDLLPENQKWLTVSYPMDVGYGYSGEVLMHYSLGESQYSFIFAEKSLWVSFIIAFVIAVAMIVLLSRNITGTISKVVRTAEDVYHGDLQSRIILNDGEEPLYIHESTDYKEDDIMILVRTMNTMISKWNKQENERDEFMSSISHDLRTPLTSIKGFLGAIQDGTIPPEKNQHYLNIVYQEVDRLQLLIENLFNSVTLDKGSDLNLSVFNIELLMQDVINSLDAIINQKGININVDCQLNDDEISVVADQAAIQRVIYNLLSNAVKFTPRDGFIRVEILPKDNETISISIEDNGEGIGKEDRENIFNRFYKVNKSRNTDGSGMGLYIVRSLLALHGQSIRVGRSSLGGAKFTFTLSRTKGRKI